MPVSRQREDKKGVKTDRTEGTRKVYCDEALGHLKGGNYSNALSAYNKVGAQYLKLYTVEE